MLFQDVMRCWLEEKRYFIKESTYAYYSFEVTNYLTPMLGQFDVKEITEERIQESVIAWQNIGMENGGPLKKSSVQNLVVLIKQVLRYADKKGYVEEKNMNIRFVPSKAAIKKEKVFSVADQNKLIVALLSEISYRNFGILLCLNSGLRIGEICALKWEDFDLENRILHITKTMQRIYQKNELPKTRIIITEPKTISSIRDIPLSDKIYQIVTQFSHKEMTAYVLTNTEHYLEPRSFRKYYKKFLDSHGINYSNFHCLRHTFATKCIENGGDYKSVSEILGHTTINTTLNMYVHPRMEEKRRCINSIQW